MNFNESNECSCQQKLQQSKLYRCEKCAQKILKDLDEKIYALKQEKKYYQIYQQQKKYQNLINVFSLQDIGLKSFYKQNQLLQNQLEKLQQQLITQEKLILNANDSYEQINKRIQSNFTQFNKKSFDIRKMNVQDNDLSYKNTALQKQIKYCQNINVTHELFKITFENDQSFINGQAIYFQNTWKIAQIISFFHHKYQTYSSTILIYLDEMILTPLMQYDEVLIQKKKKKMIKNQQIEFIQIICNSQQQTQQWLYMIAIQVLKLAQFLNQQQKDKQKLIYKMKKDGSIQGIKLNNYQKYIKYLLSNINQLIKLQFYIMESRIKVSH